LIQQQPTTATKKSSSIENSEFADFSSAFSSATFSSQQQPQITKLNNANLLLSEQPILSASSNVINNNFNNSNPQSADLFGNSVITGAFSNPQTSSSSGANKDLLSDLNDLSLLDPKTSEGEFNLIIANSKILIVRDFKIKC
jgi:hypothetical protein